MNKSVSFTYLKDEDITKDQVLYLLEKISKGIWENNKYNLTDINIMCEEIFGYILNRLYGWDLRALTAEVSPNYVAVDLIDRENRVAVQVTSRNDRSKITETITKYKKNKLNMEFDRLIILVLRNDTHEYQKPDEPIDLGNGNSFIIKNDVIDFPKLSNLIEGKAQTDNNLIPEIYDDINMVIDTGQLKPYSMVQQTLYLNNEAIINSTETFWQKGYGDVRMQANIPRRNGQSFECEVSFRRNNLSGVDITIKEEELVSDYFVDADKFSEKHIHVHEKQSTECFVVLGNCRIAINPHTVYHLYLLFQELKELYEKAKSGINSTIKQ